MTKKLGFKWLVYLVLVMFALTAFTACGGDKGGDQGNGDAQKPQTIDLTIGCGHPYAGQPYVQAMSDFFVPEVTKRVKEATGIEMKWNEAYGGSLVKLAETLEGAETGLVDFGLMPVCFEPTKLPLQNINFYMPFNTTDAVQATKITRRVFDEVPHMTELYEQQYNQKFLAVAPVGSYQLLTTFPVKRLEDIKGRKIAGAGPNLKFLEGTGAVPVQSNLNEAYTSYQTGVYEGWIMYPGSSYGFKLHEVAPYQTNVDFGNVAGVNLTINLDTWNSLPKEVQDIIVEVAKEYEMVAAEKANAADAAALEAMKKEGLTVFDLPAADREKWAAGLPNVPQQMADEANALGYPGTEVYSKYINYLAEDGFDFPRKWEVK